MADAAARGGSGPSIAGGTSSKSVRSTQRPTSRSAHTPFVGPSAAAYHGPQRSRVSIAIASQGEPADGPRASAADRVIPSPPPADDAGIPGQVVASDLDLARRALAGEPAARETVSERLAIVPRVLVVLNTRFGRPLSAHDVADLSQQVYLLAWSRLVHFDARVPLEGWFYGIARLEYLSSLRRRGRAHTPVALADATAESVPRAPTEIDGERLRATLERLDEIDARLVRLRHFDELEFDVIARELGLSLVNVRSRYYRALKRLRDLYGSETPDGAA